MEKEIVNPKMKVIVNDPDVRKKQDKLNAMRVALTYVEIQNKEVEPKKVIKIAEEFLGWITK